MEQLTMLIPHFTDDQTEFQRDEETCLGSCSQYVPELGMELR